MMQRSVAIVVVLATIAGGALLYALRGGHGAGPAVHPPARDTVAMAPGVGVADVGGEGIAPTRPGGPSPQETVVLPNDAPTPLRERFPALDAAARAGDVRAACRLAAELDRCGYAEFLAINSSPRSDAQRIARMTVDDDALEDTIEDSALYHDLVASVRAECSGLPPGTVDARSEYMAMAAIGGHIRSQVEFMSGAHLGAAAMLRDPSPLQQYREHAGAFFRNALESGELRVLAVWHQSLGYGAWPLAAYLPVEFRDRRLVSALIAELDEAQRQSVFPYGVQEIDASAPSPAQVRAAKALYARYFAQSRPQPGENADGVPLAGVRQSLSLDTHRCEDAPG